MKMAIFNESVLMISADTDECALEGSCDQLCTNSNGSFSCDCIEGYRKDGQHCRAINGWLDF